jgi:hypothetical protein
MSDQQDLHALGLAVITLHPYVPSASHPYKPTHAGLCTECGVCDDGEAFGSNVVFEPPPIPEFEGHYRPNATRAQRLRFRHACGGAGVVWCSGGRG